MNLRKLLIASIGFTPIFAAAVGSAQDIPKIPDNELVEPGKLVVCADAPVPPYTLVAEDGTIDGMDAELAAKIAGLLGLKAEVRKTVFNTIIAALSSRKCDVIMGAMNITAERQKVITQVPYAQDGQNFAVGKGNPKGFKTTMDLCGAKVATQTGTIGTDAIVGGGDHAGKGFNQACTGAGRPEIQMLQYAQTADVLLAVASGQADISIVDSSFTSVYVGEHSDLLEISPIGAQAPSPQGIGITFDRPGLKASIEAAVSALVKSGEYKATFEKFNYLEGAYLLNK